MWEQLNTFKEVNQPYIDNLLQSDNEEEDEMVDKQPENFAHEKTDESKDDLNMDGYDFSKLFYGKKTIDFKHNTKIELKEELKATDSFNDILKKVVLEGTATIPIDTFADD